MKQTLFIFFAASMISCSHSLFSQEENRAPLSMMEVPSVDTEEMISDALGITIKRESDLDVASVSSNEVSWTPDYRETTESVLADSRAEVPLQSMQGEHEAGSMIPDIQESFCWPSDAVNLINVRRRANSWPSDAVNLINVRRRANSWPSNAVNCMPICLRYNFRSSSRANSVDSNRSRGSSVGNNDNMHTLSRRGSRKLRSLTPELDNKYDNAYKSSKGSFWLGQLPDPDYNSSTPENSDEEFARYYSWDAIKNSQHYSDLSQTKTLFLKLKEIEADVIAAEAKTAAASLTDKRALWPQNIKQAREVFNDWTRVIEVFQQNLNNLNDLPTNSLEIARHRQAFWKIKKAWYQAEQSENEIYNLEWFQVRKAEQLANRGNSKKEEPISTSQKIALLDEVIMKASQTKQLWDNTVTRSKDINCFGNMIMKIWGSPELQLEEEAIEQAITDIEQHATIWSDKLSSYKEQRAKLSGVAEELHANANLLLLENEKSSFYSDLEKYNLPGALFKERIMSKDPRSGAKISISLWQTDLQYSYLRAEENVDSLGRIISRKEMAADHIIINLAEGMTAENFINQFKELNLEKASLEKIAPQCYRFFFEPVTLAMWQQVIEKAATIPEASPKPDYFSHENSHSTKEIKMSADQKQLPDDLLWNLYGERGIHAREAWQIQENASGITVAIIDSGIDFLHIALDPNNPVVGYDFINNHPNVVDENGHGTHTSGIIGANENNGEISSVAKGTGLMGVRWLDKNLYGFDSNFIKALDYACNNQAAILNCSVTQANNEYDENIAARLAMAQKKNIIVVIAAGNKSASRSKLNLDKTEFYPASYKKNFNNIIVVAASQKNSDTLANFSNYGASSVDIAAPGEDIFSTWVIDKETGQTSSPHASYKTQTGTSMAVPHVVGALALMKAKFPNASYEDLIQHLYDTADYIPELDGVVCNGRRLNLAEALKRTSDFH